MRTSDSDSDYVRARLRCQQRSPTASLISISTNVGRALVPVGGALVPAGGPPPCASVDDLCMPHWADCFKHRCGKYATTSKIHQRLQNLRSSGNLQHHKAKSIAAISHEGTLLQRLKLVIILSQQYFGRPMRPCPWHNNFLNGTVSCARANLRNLMSNLRRSCL